MVKWGSTPWEVQETILSFGVALGVTQGNEFPYTGVLQDGGGVVIVHNIIVLQKYHGNCKWTIAGTGIHFMAQYKNHDHAGTISAVLHLQKL